jgi:hypothetical protein
MVVATVEVLIPSTNAAVAVEVIVAVVVAWRWFRKSRKVWSVREEGSCRATTGPAVPVVAGTAATLGPARPVFSNNSPTSIMTILCRLR